MAPRNELEAEAERLRQEVARLREQKRSKDAIERIERHKTALDEFWACVYDEWFWFEPSDSDKMFKIIDVARKLNQELLSRYDITVTPARR
jgi:hypothetical protein